MFQGSVGGVVHLTNFRKNQKERHNFRKTRKEMEKNESGGRENSYKELESGHDNSCQQRPLALLLGGSVIQSGETGNSSTRFLEI